MIDCGIYGTTQVVPLPGLRLPASSLCKDRKAPPCGGALHLAHSSSLEAIKVAPTLSLVIPKLTHRLQKQARGRARLQSCRNKLAKERLQPLRYAFETDPRPQTARNIFRDLRHLATPPTLRCRIVRAAISQDPIRLSPSRALRVARFCRSARTRPSITDTSDRSHVGAINPIDQGRIFSRIGRRVRPEG